MHIAAVQDETVAMHGVALSILRIDVQPLTNLFALGFLCYRFRIKLGGVKRNNLNGVVYSASVCPLSPTALPHL